MKNQFLRTKFDVFDCGVVAALSPTTIAVFDALRRSIWRSDVKVFGKYSTDTHVIACNRVRQSDLADVVGISESKVWLHIDRLVKAQWVWRLTLAGSRSPAFLLGNRKTLSSGKKVEVLYAETALSKIRAAITEQAPKGRLFNLPLADRVAVARKILGVSSRVRATPSRSSPLRDATAATPSGRSDLLPDGGGAQPNGSSSPDGNGVEGIETAEESDAVAAWNREPHLNRERIGERSVGGRSAPTDGRARSARVALAGVSDDEQPDATDPTTPSSAPPPPPIDDDAEADAVEHDTRVLPPVVELERLWRALMQEHFSGVPVASWWSGSRRKPSKEAGQMGDLLAKYNGNRAVVAGGVEYMFRDWKKLRERLKKAPEVPTVGFLLAVHDTIVAESVQVARTANVEEEVEAWCRANPGRNPPDEMLARLRGQA